MKKKTFAVDIDGTITENGGGRIHLDALEALRRLTNMGHDVIYVTGRSSVEAYLLSVFGGTRKIAVGENGGCIAFDADDHVLLGNIDECNRAFELIKKNIDDVQKKPVFPRLTEVVLERTFDMNDATKTSFLKIILMLNYLTANMRFILIPKVLTREQVLQN